VDTNDMMSEIRDANLAYLMLAQQMIRLDKASAIFRLGLNHDIAELIKNLSTTQLLKLAAANVLLMRFRFDDLAVLEMLTNSTKEKNLVQSHVAILMASQPLAQDL
jgi:flagellar transcriptional activator FlhD